MHKAFLTDDKDTLWDCDRAKMMAIGEALGGETWQTRVRIEKNLLKFIVSTETAF
jgi:hypothetical protein